MNQSSDMLPARPQSPLTVATAEDPQFPQAYPRPPAALSPLRPLTSTGLLTPERPDLPPPYSEVQQMKQGPRSPHAPPVSPASPVTFKSINAQGCQAFIYNSSSAAQQLNVQQSNVQQSTVQQSTVQQSTVQQSTTQQTTVKQKRTKKSKKNLQPVIIDVTTDDEDGCWISNIRHASLSMAERRASDGLLSPQHAQRQRSSSSATINSVDNQRYQAMLRTSSSNEAMVNVTSSRPSVLE